MKKPLAPRTKINSEGKLHYSESSQAWNVLKLKKELFEEFPALKKKRTKFCYELVYHRDAKELEKNFKEIVKGKSVQPILLWLYEEG